MVGAGHDGPLFQPVSVEAVDFLAARLFAVPEPPTLMLVGIITCASAGRTDRRKAERR